MRNLIIGFLVGTILILGGLLVVSQGTYSGDTWEYQTLSVADTKGTSGGVFGEPLISTYRINGEVGTFDTPATLNSVLMALGQNGWEYVGSYDMFMIFKRKADS